MAYFNPAFVEFFKGLAANNNKEYFDKHRKLYTKEVKEPFYQFVADVISRVGDIDPAIKSLEVKNAVFRINRDIRFSADKSPYKLHVGAVISPTGRKDMQYPGLYMHLSIDESFMGGGCYMPTKENLQRIRQYIIDHPKKVEQALNDKAFKSTYGGLAEAEKNKILPKEMKAYGEDQPLLFNKQFYYMHNIPDGEQLVLRDDLLDVVVDHFRAGAAWNKVIKDAIQV